MLILYITFQKYFQSVLKGCKSKLSRYLISESKISLNVFGTSLLEKKLLKGSTNRLIYFEEERARQKVLNNLSPDELRNTRLYLLRELFFTLIHFLATLSVI